MQATLVLLVLATTVVFVAGNASITFPETSEPENAIGQDTRKEAEDSSLKEMAHHIANLGLNTLRDLLSGHSNVIISPLNVFSCLGILYLGAGGETKEEIRRVLGPPRENHTVSEIIRSREGVSYASAVFLNYGLAPKREFAAAVFAEYQASVLNVNVSDEEAAKTSINSWVADHTNGTIVDLVQGRLDPETRMVVVSTLLFKGKWLHSFPKAATAPGKFEIEDGTSVNVPLMHLLCSVPLVRNPHFDAISLPYGDDHGMRMHLILPKVHGMTALKQLLSHLNANSLRKLRKEWTSEEIFIVVPKIKVEGRFSLGNSLKKQGVISAFNPSTANFTNFAEEGADLFVSQIYHSVRFEMDEDGTVASAATASILTKSSRFAFRAIRPFIFVITDESDIVSFMGAVVRPE